jgi:two-component system CheB/CheR fusion protein
MRVFLPLCTAAASGLCALVAAKIYYAAKIRRASTQLIRTSEDEARAHCAALSERNGELEIMLSRLGAENTEFKRLNEIKSKFMSMVAHDIKQPLTSVQGYASALDDAERDPLRRKMLDNITKAAVNMNSLINDLVDVSALSEGRFSLNMKKFVYNELMDDIYHQYKVSADKKQIDLRLIEMPVKIEVVADRLRLHQTASNILNNALKFTKAGGTVEIRYYTDNGSLRTSVRDSGSGMVNIDRVRVFERFRQSDFMSDEYRRMGWGLGMSIAYDIVRAHSGVIESDSSGPGRGSSFWFTIPLEQPRTQEGS